MLKQEEFIKNWEKKEYEGKSFFMGCPEYYTTKGERVRSKSEVIIADSLYRANVPYRYEYPLYLERLVSCLFINKTIFLRGIT